MTVVRVQTTLSPDGRQGLVDGLRAQPDVTSVTSTAEGFDVELAGYGIDAAAARTTGLLRIVAPEAGVDPTDAVVVPHPDADAGGLT
jgi:hypothetical protein